MSDAHRRKKNPELVRAQLVENAVVLAADKGLDGVSIDAVSKASGVTKGGFFHHFPSKQDLIEAVFQHLIDDVDSAIERRIERDPVPHGRFTRAYLEMTLDTSLDDRAVTALWATTVTNPKLGKVWRDWFASRLASSGADESGPLLESVRFAADGIWLGLLVGVAPEDRVALRASLLSMTVPI